jgi:haloacetate dehalogenase
MERLYDVQEVWHGYANDVRGKPIDAGHFLAEEKPEETGRELVNFLEEEVI